MGLSGLLKSQATVLGVSPLGNDFKERGRPRIPQIMSDEFTKTVCDNPH
jgi:hypothetical protein